jgi:hypothetical protein
VERFLALSQRLEVLWLAASGLLVATARLVAGPG